MKKSGTRRFIATAAATLTIMSYSSAAMACYLPVTDGVQQTVNGKESPASEAEALAADDVGGKREMLESTIKAAFELLNTIGVSELEGLEYLPDQKWTVPDDVEAFEKSIKNAQAVLNETNADYAAAAKELEAAMQDFVSSATDGTAQVLDVKIQTIDGIKLLTGLTLNTQSGDAPYVAELAANLRSDERVVRISDEAGQVAAADQLCATGMIVDWTEGKDSAVIAVAGDVLGTGKISLSQVRRLAAGYTGQEPLEGAFRAAADFDRSGEITLADLIQEAEMYKAHMSDQGVSQAPVAGGWNMPQTPVLSEDELRFFESASGFKPGNDDYTPIACVGYQIVSGRNYRFLCTTPSRTGDGRDLYAIVSIYVNLQQQSEVIDIMASNCQVPEFGNLSGGWYEPETPDVTVEAANAIRNADSAYAPAALAAEQVVAGMNYLLCCSKNGKYSMVQVYSRFDGTAKITEIYNFSAPNSVIGRS